MRSLAICWALFAVGCFAPAPPPDEVTPIVPRVEVKAPARRDIAAPKAAPELKATLERINAGEHFPHKNDGSVFGNYEGRLPKKPKGYYREYVHPTPGVSGPGARRVVLGKGGEIFYSADHYETFQRVSPEGEILR